jgi:hypothetical protein
VVGEWVDGDEPGVAAPLVVDRLDVVAEPVDVTRELEARGRHGNERPVASGRFDARTEVDFWAMARVITGEELEQECGAERIGQFLTIFRDRLTELMDEKEHRSA